MSTHWVVIADRSRARIFEATGGFDALHEVEDLLNPQGRLDDCELGHDAKGRYYGRGERHQGDTAEPKVSPREHQEEKFSRDVMDVLTRGCDTKRFDRLVMVAPPEFLGLLRKQMPLRVVQHVAGELHSDISNFPMKKIGEYLKQHLHS